MGGERRRGGGDRISPQRTTSAVYFEFVFFAILCARLIVGDRTNRRETARESSPTEGEGLSMWATVVVEDISGF